MLRSLAVAALLAVPAPARPDIPPPPRRDTAAAPAPREVAGTPSPTDRAPVPDTSSTTSPLATMAFVVALGAGVIWWRRRTERPKSPPAAG